MPPRDPSFPSGDETLTLAEAAVLLSSGRGIAGQRLARAVEAQLRLRDVPDADRDDVRADVAFALLVSARRDRLTLDVACAHAASIARNKAVDHHRRRRHDSAGGVDRLAVPVVGRLGHDLDVVAGEVHRGDVSRALDELIGELPAPERLALTATATGTGLVGSGLGRSSHYRALERARLRLTSAVRSRIAGGLALPLLLLRNAGVVRDVLAPLGAVAIAGVASAALVLPATDLPASPLARPLTASRITQVTVAVARAPLAPAVRVRHRPLPITPRTVTARRLRRLAPPPTPPAPIPTPTSTPTPQRSLRRSVPPLSSTPDAGLGPCRAALLCK